jgi:hypothetical protein
MWMLLAFAKPATSLLTQESSTDGKKVVLACQHHRYR